MGEGGKPDRDYLPSVGDGSFEFPLCRLPLALIAKDINVLKSMSLLSHKFFFF